MNIFLRWLAAMSFGAVTACAASAPAPETTAGTKGQASSVPARQQLEFIAGTWNFEGTMGTEPLVFHEVCTWIDGGFHIQCATGGTQDGFSLLGYQADAGVYTHYNIGADGQARALTGRIVGSEWIWTGQSMKDGKPRTDRVTMTPMSADEFKFRFERSVDGAAWTTRLSGTYRRGPAPLSAPPAPPAPPAPTK